MGTLIRQFRLGLALQVVVLPVQVVPFAFQAALIAAVGFTVLPETRCRTATLAAIALSAITMRADEEQRVAIAAQTKPRAENRIAVFHHAPSGRALTTAVISWQVRTSFHAWWPCHKRLPSWNPAGCTAGFYFASKDTLHLSKMMMDDERACGADDVAGPSHPASHQKTTFSDD